MTLREKLTMAGYISGSTVAGIIASVILVPDYQLHQQPEPNIQLRNHHLNSSLENIETMLVRRNPATNLLNV